MSGPTASMDRRLAWYVRALGLFGLGMLAATYRLWLPQQSFPQVPLLATFIGAPRWLDLAALAATAAALAWLLLAPSRGTAVAGALLTVALGLLFLLDQHRLQPWAWQLALAGAVLAGGRPGRRELLQLLVLGIYAHSALSKLDAEFLGTLGQSFLQGLVGPLGGDVTQWDTTSRLLAASAFPVAELLLAAGLAWPASRPAAIGLAVLLHAALIGLLGPWGLNHEPAVLLWNGLFLVQAWLLFGEPDTEAPGKRPASNWRSGLAALTIWIAVLLPLSSRAGWYDHWPAWGLYSTCNPRARVFVPRLAAERLPADVRRHLAPGETPWAELSLQSWSLTALSAPVYPQDRFQLAVAWAMAERYELGSAVRVVREGPPDRFTGKRAETVWSGSEALRRAAASYRLNVRPRRLP